MNILESVVMKAVGNPSLTIFKHPYMDDDSLSSDEDYKDPPILAKALGALDVDVILEEIFSVLPFESLESCVLVSRRWRVLANAEIKRYSFIFGADQWKQAYNLEIGDVPPIKFRSPFMVLIPQGLSWLRLENKSNNGRRAAFTENNRVCLNLHRYMNVVSPASNLFEAAVARVTYYVATGEVLCKRSKHSAISGIEYNLYAEVEDFSILQIDIARIYKIFRNKNENARSHS